MTSEARSWSSFITPSDAAWVASRSPRQLQPGKRPALLLIDLYRGGFGDKREPLLESIRRWPWSAGEAGWEALPFIQKLLESARTAGVPVVHSTMRSSADGLRGWMEVLHPEGKLAHSSMTTETQKLATEIIPEAAPIAGEVVIEKSAPSAFWGTPLIAHLSDLGIDCLLVAGMATSGCVRATVVDGAANRLRMFVVEEAVFDRFESSHAISLFDIHQKYGAVISLNDALGQISRYTSGEPKKNETRNHEQA